MDGSLRQHKVLHCPSSTPPELQHPREGEQAASPSYWLFFAGPPIRRSTHWSISPLVDWLFDWLINRAINLLVRCRMKNTPSCSRLLAALPTVCVALACVAQACGLRCVHSSHRYSGSKVRRQRARKQASRSDALEARKRLKENKIDVCRPGKGGSGEVRKRRKEGTEPEETEFVERNAMIICILDADFTRESGRLWNGEWLPNWELEMVPSWTERF